MKEFFFAHPELSLCIVLYGICYYCYKGFFVKHWYVGEYLTHPWIEVRLLWWLCFSTIVILGAPLFTLAELVWRKCGIKTLLNSVLDVDEPKRVEADDF